MKGLHDIYQNIASDNNRNGPSKNFLSAGSKKGSEEVRGFGKISKGI